jgi:ABC-2 type transport system ATP-binding protein
MQPEAPPAIQTYGLTRTIGEFSLRDINLHVPAGALCAALGAPGSGKTMLIKLLLGLDDPDAGQRMIFGQHVAPVPFEIAVGYAPQTNFLSEKATVQDMLRYIMFLSGQQYADLSEVQDVLDAVRLTASLHQSIGALNIGQRQRLRLAQSLIGNPKLLLLDESAAALTDAERHEFLDIVRDISANRTVLYTTSISEDVHYASDYLIVLHEGTLIAQGVTSDLIENADYALYRVCVRGESSTVHDLLAEQSWIYSIQVQQQRDCQHWLMRVRDEDQAERSLLRAILADRSLSILDFKKERGRLMDFIAAEHIPRYSNLPTSN